MINNTLTSDITTEALSAAQGKVLTGLISVETSDRTSANTQLQSQINKLQNSANSALTLQSYGYDLNALHKAGFYSTRSCANRPNNSGSYATVLVSKTDSTIDDSSTDTAQMYIDKSNDIYVRNCTDSGSWTDWKKFSGGGGGDEEYVLKCYTSSTTITLPSDAIHNEIDVVCVAGGGGGYAHVSNRDQSGGTGGGVVADKITIGTGADKTAQIIVGGGGTGCRFYEEKPRQGGDTEFKYDGNYKMVANGDYMAEGQRYAGKIEKCAQFNGFKLYRSVRSVGVQSDRYFSHMLPTKSIFTVNGGDGGYFRYGHLERRPTTAWSAGGDGASRKNENGENATEYGCGGGGGLGGTSSDGEHIDTLGGNGKQGCVYIGYWRKKK